MGDGLRPPGKPDGMAAFEGPSDRVVLVRNHELDDNETFDSPFGITNEWISKIDSSRIFDSGGGFRPQIGGTTNIVYNPKSREVESDFLSLAGTARNCAGGPTPWNTWITCEETVIRKRDEKDEETAVKGRETEEKPDPWCHLEHAHGYNFEVLATSEMGLCDPIPLKDMGRFNHEAVAVDPSSGVVYQLKTETTASSRDLSQMSPAISQPVACYRHW